MSLVTFKQAVATLPRLSHTSKSCGAVCVLGLGVARLGHRQPSGLLFRTRKCMFEVNVGTMLSASQREDMRA